MPPVKSLDRISEKWARVAGVSQEEYIQGIKNPRTDWAKATSDSEANYDRGVQAAIQRKAFGKGVAKAGTAKWQERALVKGPARWAEGINVSRDAYEKAFAPYREVLMRTPLPPRGPRGDAKNYARVQIIGDALHKEKLSRQGA